MSIDNEKSTPVEHSNLDMPEASGSPSSASKRLLIVHAHPDDETIGTGALMARYNDEGAHVALVTCTLGEEGEVLVPELEHLGAAHEDQLGPHRIGEIRDAMEALDIADWRFLGEAGKYRDSGMMGEPSNNRENCFWQADLLAASQDLVPVIREQRPQVLITYNEFGGYGHPDHIQAHRVAMYAAQLAAAPGFKPELGKAWSIPKIYWTAMPFSMIRRAFEVLKEEGRASGWSDIDPENIPFGTPDELVTTRIDSRAFHPQKLAAMKSYPTQMTMEDGFFSLALTSDDMSIEFLQLVQGELGARDPDGFEDDIFAGLDLD